MQNDKGFIVIDRKILEWEWYKVPNMVTLFTHLLIKANWESKKWQGKVIKRGQLVTGRKELAISTGLSEQQVRSCLEKLRKTKEVTIKTTNKYSIISITNYDFYQSPNQQITNNQPTTENQPAKIEVNSNEYQDFIAFRNQQATNKQPTNNQQITTTKPLNNITIKQDKKTKAKKEVFLCRFEEFWKLYPKTAGSKKTAKKKWEIITRNESPDTLISAVEPYKHYCQATQTPHCHPTTWLNQERWKINYDQLINEHQRNPGNNRNASRANQKDYMGDVFDVLNGI